MGNGMRQRKSHRPIETLRHGCIVPLHLLFLILLVQPSSSSTQPPSFDPDNIDLFGDAHVVVAADGVSHVRLTRPAPSSSGLLRRREPLAFAGAASLSTEFSFSVSPAAGDGLLLLLAPAPAAAFPGNGSDYVGVEFDTSKDDSVGDVNANRVGIDVGSHVSVAVANVSDANLVLNNGEKLNAWVDYEGSSKVLEVRLSKWGEQRPPDPIVSHSIDFVKIWGGDPVFAGISSSNGANSAQVVSVYWWRLSLREVAKGLHSLPADPHGNKFEDKHTKLCPLTVLAGVIFGTGCVALVTFVVLFMWVIFFHGRQEESLVKIPDHPSDIRYERIDVAVDKNAQDDES
ncbi:L-type lectin-domain containing receptor kinase VIII.2 [Spatholobus suberectus]|nr:L-type lectin-domain containing receptor kinase VIII.2 [Spatholobus suberectus]